MHRRPVRSNLGPKIRDMTAFENAFRIAIVSASEITKFDRLGIESTYATAQARIRYSGDCAPARNLSLEPLGCDSTSGLMRRSPRMGSDFHARATLGIVRDCVLLLVIALEGSRTRWSTRREDVQPLAHIASCCNRLSSLELNNNPIGVPDEMIHCELTMYSKQDVETTILML